MLLRRLQESLGRIYDIPLEHDVCDFLVTDRAALARENRAAMRHDAEEELLVRQDGDEVRVSLYVDPRVLERLSGQNPLEALDSGNLADFWTALEGVSHFQYLAWNAGFDRPVSIHELEMQAEVDKYAATLFLLGAQQAGRFPQRLHHWLFERGSIDSSLSHQKRQMYASANRYAARFCRALEERFLRRGRVRCEALVRELRHFYRLTHAPKIRLIEVGHAH
jgi:hypothetical protein